ncbi:MAG: SRPBCC family protein, partial [Schleiferiaceae bacterium]|nr:SRPBCC family protein [Schleiferiaceae bacterium]
VFAYTGDLSHFESWTMWFQGDTLDLTVSNPSSGSGASVFFDDKKGTSGKFLFTKVVRPTTIDYEVYYNNRLGSVGTLSFAPENRGTKVTWTFEGEMPFYFRWVILSMDRKVGKDFEESLSLLKKNIESIAIEEENS